MGHHQVEGMARTTRYARVVAKLGLSAGAGWGPVAEPGTLTEIAALTLDACLEGLERAKQDQGLAYCVYLMGAVTHAARSADFDEALGDLGVSRRFRRVGLPDAAVAVAVGADDSGGAHTAWELVCDFSEAVDRHLGANRARSDIADMAQLSASETLDVLCADASTSLYDGVGLGAGGAGAGGAATGVRGAMRALSTDKGFGRVAHEFFARFTSRFLQYHLSRELSNHVGSGRRFATVEEHNGFLEDLDRHCRVSTTALREFTEEWYGKRKWQKDLTLNKARGYVCHALDKVRLSLAHQEGGHVDG